MVRRLILVTSALALACSDFNGAYERCVAEGKCIEEGRPSTATSELSVSRSTATADGTDAVTVRVVLRDLAGAAVANQTARLEVTGTANTLETVGLSDASGTIAVRLTSTHAEQKFISAFITVDGVETQLSGNPWVQFQPGPPDPQLSTVVATPSSVAADGVQASTLDITLTDAHGNPVVGAVVTLDAISGQATLSPLPPTNAQGKTSARASSVSLGLVVVGATAGTQSGLVTLTQTARVLFTPAPPQVSEVFTDSIAVGGCVPIHYSLAQLQGRPTSVKVEYALGLAGFKPASIAGGDGDGVLSLRSGSAGTQHTFLWNSTVDLGRRNALDLFLRVTPTLNGVTGQAAATRVTLQNGVAFAQRRDHIIRVGRGYGLYPADVNRDGKLDLVMYHPPMFGFGANLSVHLGNGDLTFTETFGGSVGGSTGTSEIRVADVNGDGILDVLGADGTRALVLPGLGDGGFGAMIQSAIGTGISDAAYGDFDRDGDLDLVTVHSATSQYGFSAGGAGGTFGAVSLAALGIGASTVRAGDFNRDGKLDVVAMNSTGAARLLLGNGNGTFQAPVALTLGTSTTSLHVADLDGDARTDLLVRDVGQVSWLRGQGDGTFAAAVPIAPTGGPDFVLSDLDRDGTPELVTSEGYDGVKVFKRRIGGTFELISEQATNGGATGVTVADFDADGRMDLMANTSNLTLHLFPGRQPLPCDPSFVGTHSLLARDNPTAVVTGDFNEDGKLDVVSTAASLGSVSVLLGDGSGGFAERAVLPAAAEEGLGAGDFNRDGRLDLVSVDRVAGQVTQLLGIGDGTFLTATRYPTGAQPQAMVVADFDADGWLDVAAIDGSDATVSLLRGRAPQGFEARVVSPAGVDPKKVAAGDLDGDGRPDLVVLSGTGQARVLRNMTGSSFEQVGSFDVPSGADVVIADLDGDGARDFVVGVDGATQDAVVYLGHGNFSFDAPRTYSVGTRFGLYALLPVDLDADGDLDLVAAQWNSGQNLSVLLNDGLGALGPPQRYIASLAANALAAGDIQGDGNPDLFVASDQSISVSMFFGNGDGTLRATPQAEAAGTVVADFNGDGIVDLAGSTSLSLSNGDGSFQPPILLPTPALTNLAAADVNRDGKVDLVSTSNTVMRVQLGNGDGTFVAPADLALTAGVGYQQLLLVDLDRDGWLDVLTAGPNNSNLGFYRNTRPGFAAIANIALSRTTRRIAVGDINRDGWLDLVQTTDGNFDAYVYLANGAGGFNAGVRNVLNNYGKAVELADLDRDGFLELIFATNTGASVGFVEVMPGNGTATFGATRRSVINYDPTALSVEDLNNDGALDVAVAHNFSAQVSVLAGDNQGGLAPAEVFSLNARPLQLRLADLNRDARVDLISSDGTNASYLLAR